VAGPTAAGTRSFWTMIWQSAVYLFRDCNRQCVTSVNNVYLKKTGACRLDFKKLLCVTVQDLSIYPAISRKIQYETVMLPAPSMGLGHRPIRLRSSLPNCLLQHRQMDRAMPCSKRFAPVKCSRLTQTAQKR